MQKQEIKDLQSEYDLHKQQSLGKHGSMQEALEKEIEKLKKQYADVTLMLEKEKCDRITAQDGRKMAEDKCKDFRRELEAEKEAHNDTEEKLVAANKEIDSP